MLNTRGKEIEDEKLRLRNDEEKLLGIATEVSYDYAYEGCRQVGFDWTINRSIANVPSWPFLCIIAFGIRK